MSAISPVALPESPVLSLPAHASRQAVGNVSDSPAKVAGEFESLFTSLILKEMRKTLQPDTLFGQDPSDVYGGLFDLFLGQHMAKAGGIGISRMVQEALQRDGAALPERGLYSTRPKLTPARRAHDGLHPPPSLALRANVPPLQNVSVWTARRIMSNLSEGNTR